MGFKFPQSPIVLLNEIVLDLSGVLMNLKKHAQNAAS